ncbi:uncharacterized protein LOC113646054 isoform X2 [Tachysurus fulvidraco]|uniref:uncharacterized protein LOC113646054 isoform X2 n=1 Tax=Tachysurus fulvidraco TaxID=1234273 RepID=UPI001FF02262|nr:uncharacterized protein LOC113646054 isoform X2 [Tachysurus fulvidraco]
MMIIMMIMMMWITVVSTQNSDVSQPDPWISAGVGENVTLSCFKLNDNNPGSVVWYKHKVGHEPRIIVAVQHEPLYENEFKPPKFSIENDKKSCHLKITNVEPSDEAVYYCGYRIFLTRFGNGTFLSVKGTVDVKVRVWQHNVWDSVPAGASVTLQCSVLSESRAAELQVLWFRAAPPQSHPQIIYTHHNSSRQCEIDSSTHTCVYNFSKNILSLNDTGTYYCAVLLCGKIIFGNGTPVQMATEKSTDPVVIYLAVALGVCVLVIVAHIATCRGKSQECKVKKTENKSRDAGELNYVASLINKKTGKTERAHDNIYTEVIYSSVS